MSDELPPAATESTGVPCPRCKGQAFICDECEESLDLCTCANPGVRICPRCRGGRTA